MKWFSVIYFNQCNYFIDVIYMFGHKLYFMLHILKRAPTLKDYVEQTSIQAETIA